MTAAAMFAAKSDKKHHNDAFMRGDPTRTGSRRGAAPVG